MGDATDAIPESTNRLNKDSYQLFEVGNLKFLMVSLEVGMPQYSVDWANALVDAYPDRRVIITTHAFIDASGEPSDAARSTAPTACPRRACGRSSSHRTATSTSS